MSKPLRSFGYRTRDELALHKALNKAVQQYLNDNHEHRFADNRMLMKIVFLSAVCFALYVLMLTVHSKPAFLFSYAGFLFSTLFLAVNVVHDASHNAIFRQEWANRWLNNVLTIPLGLDADCWRVRHTICHHGHTNIKGYDLDIEENGILRQTPYQRWWFLMRWQHYYWPVAAALTFPIFIWVTDWLDRAGLTQVTPKLRHRGIKGWGYFLLSKALHLTISLLVPMMAARALSISTTEVIVAYLLSQMLSSLIFVVLILGTHWAKAKFYLPPEQGSMPHGWYHHNFSTTFDWLTTPQCLTYWIGGLNMHLTHHLYPNWNHRHYLKLAKVIEQTVSEFNIEYHCVTLRELFRYQQKFLREMGNNKGPDEDNFPGHHKADGEI
ncbi:fatty acid desaturase family protein [Budvicia aquatica]|uniref:Acyl-CoA desaturase n=1 Tax=Budvicia aquatica TaxID=82979 RepID=A0A2C6DHW3_9GAMM|nr:acyl-CoA desaturase [Budvicia aquatica]PHI28354.1 acyl-CoA desaturase [Budvicia aquatica]VFS46254.1 Fatty acid desaturase [Budvicia aquatica]